MTLEQAKVVSEFRPYVFWTCPDMSACHEIKMNKFRVKGDKVCITGDGIHIECYPEELTLSKRED